MTTYILLIFMLSFSFLFLNSFHPVSFIFIILMQTILICLITGLFLPSFWFSYVLFLIFLGGLLILFIYMASLAANEVFYFSFTKNNIIFSSILLFMLSYFYFLNSGNHNFDFLNNNMFLDYETNALMMFSYTSLLSATLMILFLLITLIAVVKVSQHQFGPLRQSF